jgi:cobalt-zinc-cadmium resistance protein CzcA
MNAVGGSPAVASPLPASPAPDGVIERLVAWAVQQRALVAGLVLALVGAGLWALNTLRVDAFPDLTDAKC